MSERGFGDDVQGLIRLGSEMDWQVVCEQVLAWIAFLGDQDERDDLFLDLVKYLLRKPYPRSREKVIQGLKHPLAWLMEGLPLSMEAAVLTQEEMKPYVHEVVEHSPLTNKMERDGPA